MRPVTVAALMLSAVALTARAAGTMDWCTADTRILTDRVITMNEDLTTYRGVNCESDPNVNIVFDASATADGWGVTATFSDGTIGEGGSLQIIGPAGDRANAVAPILIRIERNVFAKDAVLHVKGSFPTTSLISIAGNRFDVGKQHPILSGLSEDFISAITFGDVNIEMYLFTNVQFTVYDNVINVEDRTDGSKPYHCYGVYASSHLYLGNEAGFLVQRNKVTGATQDPTSMAVGVHCPRYAFLVGNNTLVQISNNEMELTNGIAFQAPAVAISDYCTGHGDFSTNNARLTPAHDSTRTVVLGPVNMTASSTYEVGGNVVVNERPGATTDSVRMIVNGPVHVRGDSEFSMWFNKLNVQGGSPQLLFGGPVRTEQNGRVNIVGNELQRLDGLRLGLSPLQFFSLNIADNSTVSISQNACGGTNSNNPPLFIAATNADDAPASGKTANATLNVCWNSWFGSAFADVAAIEAAIDPKFHNMINDLSECPAFITTTTAAPRSTTPPATTAGGNQGNGAQSAAKAVAASALLAAVLACLV